MFDEAIYYASFKRVRNKFRKYRYPDIISLLLAYLHSPAKDDVEYLQRQPWFIMLLIKWLVIDDDYPNTRAKLPTKDDALYLLQSVIDLTSKARLPTNYEHISLFFRNVAYQQFLYQIGFHMSRLSRQSIIFSSLDKNHVIKKERELRGQYT